MNTPLDYGREEWDDHDADLEPEDYDDGSHGLMLEDIPGWGDDDFGFAADLDVLIGKLISDYERKLGDNPNQEDLVWTLVTIRDMRAALQDLYKRVEFDLMTKAGKKRFTIMGLGEVEIKKVTKRTNWDNEGLTRKLVALALDERILNETTGEYESSHEAVARVLSECSRPSWRVTPLRARNVPVDEYCTEEDEGYSVAIPKVRA